MIDVAELRRRAQENMGDVDWSYKVVKLRPQDAIKLCEEIVFLRREVASLITRIETLQDEIASQQLR
jgi:hypothetical protein